MLAYAKSDIGLSRKTNEDNFECGAFNLYIVADGMGGHLAGEVASSLVIKEIKNYINSHIHTYVEDYGELLKLSILYANDIIYNKSLADPLYKGMGTTVSAAWFIDNKIFWAHVGDSRIYLLKDGNLGQITKDHSLVNDLLEKGEIEKESIPTHPLRNMLTRAVGVNEYLEVDTGYMKVNQGNYVLLTTDGLTNLISDDELKDIILTNQCNLSKSLDIFIEKAIAAGGEDNITAILIGDF